MFKYAQIDLNSGVCVSVSYLAGEMAEPNLLLLAEGDDVEPGDVYDGSAWTRPVPPTPDPKEAKIAELNKACNATILAGYESSALGTPHHYDFDYEAQINLAGTKEAFNDAVITEITWKTDAGDLAHDQSQFVTIYYDGFAHKNSNIQRYKQLKAQVLAATTQEEIDAIVW